MYKIGVMESSTISKEQFYPSESFIDVYDQYLREMIYATSNKTKLENIFFPTINSFNPGKLFI